jgi:hypothetical protein
MDSTPVCRSVLVLDGSDDLHQIAVLFFVLQLRVSGLSFFE